MSRHLKWVEGLRIISWYIHVSYLFDEQYQKSRIEKGKQPLYWIKPLVSLEKGEKIYKLPKYQIFDYNPDVYIFEPGKSFGDKRKIGLREDLNKDLQSIRYRCVICGLKASDDHLIAKKDKYAQGTDEPYNYLPLCKEHNSSKGSKDLLEWTVEKFNKPYWIYLKSENPLIISSGGALRPNNGGIGRNVLRLYLYNRYQSLKAGNLLNAYAPQFLVNYIYLMEAELKIPSEFSEAIYFLSKKNSKNVKQLTLSFNAEEARA